MTSEVPNNAARPPSTGSATTSSERADLWAEFEELGASAKDALRSYAANTQFAVRADWRRWTQGPRTLFGRNVLLRSPATLLLGLVAVPTTLQFLHPSWLLLSLFNLISLLQ